MLGRYLGALRLWGYKKNDLPDGFRIGSCCVLRSLIVSLDKTWSEEHAKYVPKEPHVKVVEKWAGTAIEPLAPECAA